jgi:hypothetical protein
MALDEYIEPLTQGSITNLSTAHGNKAQMHAMPVLTPDETCNTV